MAVLGTTDISTTKVRNALGESSNDVGLLCKSPNVNKFSKFKPVQHTKIFSMVDEDFKNAKYGLHIAKLATPYDTGNWVYRKPGGYSSQPFRLGDFRKYYHAAPMALRQFYGKTMKISPFFDKTYGVVFEILPPPLNMGGYCLGIHNIIPDTSSTSAVLLDNYYLGAVLLTTATYPVEKVRWYSTKKLGYSTTDPNNVPAGYDKEKSIIDLEPVGSKNIKLVAAGSYKLHLFISTKNTGIPPNQVGEPPAIDTNEYWPINNDTSFPRTIDVTIMGLANVFTAEVTGIRPTSAPHSWADTPYPTEGWLLGNISEVKTGKISKFDIKVKITNVSGENTMIYGGNIRLYYNQLHFNTSTGTYSITEKNATYPNNVGILKDGLPKEIIFTDLQIGATGLPATNVPAYQLGVEHDLWYKLKTLEGERFPQNPSSAIILNYPAY